MPNQPPAGDAELEKQIDAIIKHTWEVAVACANKRDDEYLAWKDATRADKTKFLVQIIHKRDKAQREALIARIESKIKGTPHCKDIEKAWCDDCLRQVVSQTKAALHQLKDPERS